MSKETNIYGKYQQLSSNQYTMCRTANEKTCHPHLVSIEKFHLGISLQMEQYIQHLIFFFFKGSDFKHCALPFQKDKKGTETQKE